MFCVTKGPVFCFLFCIDIGYCTQYPGPFQMLLGLPRMRLHFGFGSDECFFRFALFFLVFIYNKVLHSQHCCFISDSDKNNRTKNICNKQNDKERPPPPAMLRTSIPPTRHRHRSAYTDLICPLIQMCMQSAHATRRAQLTQILVRSLSRIL